MDGVAPIYPRLARTDDLQKTLTSELFPKFVGVTGPVSHIDPLSSQKLAMDCLKLLWPRDSLCEHIAVETNAYARQVCVFVGESRCCSTEEG